jgi:hypothetical protein
MFGFEDTLRHEPQSLLQRSMYLEQLRPYYELLGKERVKVVVMEDFLARKREVLLGICQFLQIDFDKLPDNSFHTHSNKAALPKYPRLQAFRNRIFRNFGSNLYLKHLPNAPSVAQQRPNLFVKILDKVHSKINPHLPVPPPKMHTSTKQLLDDFFEKSLAGLDELTGEDILSKWFPNKIHQN